MRKKLSSAVSSCVSFFGYIIVILVLAVIVFIMLIPRTTYESFQDQLSSRTLYRKSNNYDSDLKTMFSTLSDNDDMLIMSGCYQVPYSAIQNPNRQENNMCLIYNETIYTSSFNDVRAKIISMLQTLKNKNNGQKLEGPAYVMISQAPYMRDDKGNVITMQFNTSAYNFEPINYMKTGSSINDANKPLLFRISIALTSYYPNLMKLPSPFDLRMFFSPLKSKKNQCFISCIGDTTNSYCGCMNNELNPNDKQSYASKCSSTPLSMDGQTVDMTKNEESDFFILYNLNLLSSIIIKSDVFNA